MILAVDYHCAQTSVFIKDNLVMIIVCADADLHVVNKRGNNILHCAIEDTSILKYLLERTR